MSEKKSIPFSELGKHFREKQSGAMESGAVVLQSALSSLGATPDEYAKVKDWLSHMRKGNLTREKVFSMEDKFKEIVHPYLLQEIIDRHIGTADSFDWLNEEDFDQFQGIDYDKTLAYVTEKARQISRNDKGRMSGLLYIAYACAIRRTNMISEPTYAAAAEVFDESWGTKWSDYRTALADLDRAHEADAQLEQIKSEEDAYLATAKEKTGDAHTVVSIYETMLTQTSKESPHPERVANYMNFSDGETLFRISPDGALRWADRGRDHSVGPHDRFKLEDRYGYVPVSDFLKNSFFYENNKSVPAREYLAAHPMFSNRELVGVFYSLRHHAKGRLFAVQKALEAFPFLLEADYTLEGERLFPKCAEILGMKGIHYSPEDLIAIAFLEARKAIPEWYRWHPEDAERLHAAKEFIDALERSGFFDANVAEALKHFPAAVSMLWDASPKKDEDAAREFQKGFDFYFQHVKDTAGIPSAILKNP